VIKASGAKSKLLKFNDFKLLLNGQSIPTQRKSFNVNWKKLEINIVETKMTLKGLNHPAITLFNSEDTNFRAISYPKSYPILISNFITIEEEREDKNMMIGKRKEYENFFI